MKEKGADRRVQRTHQLLNHALLSLIQEKGFEALTVQDIIDRANVGRSTFYAHFADKEDLFLRGFDSLSTDLKERQRQALREGTGSEDRTFAFSHEVFAHANDHRDIYRAMVGKQSGAIITRHFQDLLLELVREDVKVMAGRGKHGAAAVEAVAQYVAGALNGLMSWWMDGKMRLSVEEVNALFRRMAIPAVKAALR
jgi:AcrR family transcriptional regulator